MLVLRAFVVVCLCAGPAFAAEPFRLVEARCTSERTGPTKYVDPAEIAGAESLRRVFGEGSRPIGIVGERAPGAGGWSRLPRFFADLRVWADGKMHSNGATYMLRDRQYRVNSIAMTVFSTGNPEVLLKVFVGAPYGYGLQAWVYASAATDLPMELRVWDVDTRRIATWRKGAGPAIALTDTETMLGSDCWVCGQDPWC